MHLRYAADANKLTSSSTKLRCVATLCRKAPELTDLLNKLVTLMAFIATLMGEGIQ